jgi:hypothetical protein
MFRCFGCTISYVKNVGDKCDDCLLKQNRYNAEQAKPSRYVTDMTKDSLKDRWECNFCHKMTRKYN